MQNKNNLSFTEKVHVLTAKIPRGKVATYETIARALGKPRSYRAVGTALGKNTNYKNVPCYRVVRSNGELGEYSRIGYSKKKQLIRDGIPIKNGKVVNLNDYLYRFR